MTDMPPHGRLSLPDNHNYAHDQDHHHDTDNSAAELSRTESFPDRETTMEDFESDAPGEWTTELVHLHRELHHTRPRMSIRIPTSHPTTAAKADFSSRPVTQTRFMASTNNAFSLGSPIRGAITSWDATEKENDGGIGHMSKQSSDMSNRYVSCETPESETTLILQDMVKEEEGLKNDGGTVNIGSTGPERFPKGKTKLCSCTEYTEAGNEKTAYSTVTSMATYIETVTLRNEWDLWVEQYYQSLADSHSKEEEKKDRREAESHASAARKHSPPAEYSSFKTNNVPPLHPSSQTLVSIRQTPEHLRPRDATVLATALEVKFDSTSKHRPANTPRQLPNTYHQTPTLYQAPSTNSFTTSTTEPDSLLLPGGTTGLSLDFVFPPFPFWATMICTALLGLAIICCFIVYFINFPQSILLRWTWQGPRDKDRKSVSKKKMQKRGRKWEWLRNPFNITRWWYGPGYENGKLKKIARSNEYTTYERVANGIPEPTSPDNTPPSAISTIFSPTDSAIPLRRRRRTHPTNVTEINPEPAATPMCTPNPHHSSRPPSPENPFLIPPQPNTRTSDEWLQQRAKFFNTENPGPTNFSPINPLFLGTPSFDPESQLPLRRALVSRSTRNSISSTPAGWSVSVGGQSVENLIAAERGRDLEGGGLRDAYPCPFETEEKSAEGGVLDGLRPKWLGMIDEVVGRVVDRIERFTREGGEEEEVLPVRR